MPQRQRAQVKFENFNMPVSYRTNAQDRMRDARNVYTNQNLLESRNGVRRFNSNIIANGGNIISISFFKDSSGNRYYIAKVGGKLYSVSEVGAHTEIHTGLSEDTKHRSVTFNGRAIISVEEDGLFAWDGTTFSELGQDPPTAPTVAASGAGNSLDPSVYQVALTYYASSTGFETNQGTASSNVTVAAGEQIDITNIPTNPENDFIDTVYIYLRDVTNDSEFFFWDEIDLGITTDTIDSNPISTQIPPTTNAKPLEGGGKYLAIFGKKLVYSGSDQFKEDVFFSEDYLADAFDDRTSNRIVVKAALQGPVTALGVGFYNNDNLSPYLAIFKRNSIEIYSELGGYSDISLISTNVGCVSHDTVREIAGDLYFLTTSGWGVIRNGRVVEKDNRPFKLGDGDIDNIFTEKGYVYEVNKTEDENFFSVYYPILNQYMTWVSEGSNTLKNKSYNYEFQISGFRPYEYQQGYNGGCLAEDNDGNEIVLLAGDGGWLYEHGTNIERRDVDTNGNDVIIDVFAQLYWIAHEDMDATMNFGTMIFKAQASENDITVKCFLDYIVRNPTDKDYSFDDPASGFILDISILDEGILGDGRTIVRSLGSGVYKTSQSLLIGFYQSILDGNIKLIEGQIDASKNGNPN